MSFWALFKGGYMSVAQVRRYLADLSGRHNIRNADTAEQMRSLAGRLLTWKMLAGRAGCEAAA